MRTSALAAVACLLVAQAVGAQSLRNAAIRADFGPRGLTAVTDIAGARTDTLRRDDFAITIGGVTMDSRALAAPIQERGAGSVTYTFASGPWKLHARYELQPGWRFVSKTLSVTALAARTFTVDSVTPLALQFARPASDTFRPTSARPSLGTRDYGAAYRFGARHSLLLLLQNPFVQVGGSVNAATLQYAPALSWRADYGTFTADRALIAPVALSGRKVDAAMTPEWQPLSHGAPGLDEAEVSAFTHMVRSSFIYEPAAPLNVFVGWCVNDYQIDVGTPAGRAEYVRLFDRATSVGAQYVLYAPSNSTLAKREDSVDDWSWEHVLWLGLGQKIRRNEWNPRTSAIPPSVQEMLDAAMQRNLKLLAYVYPVLPFSQDSQWLVRARGRDSTRKAASLGNRALQDWLIEELVAFHDRTGIAGYSFDHTFLDFKGQSAYAQWYGWRRVMEELRRRVPGIVIDGRQAYHQYGPWSYLAGSYPHPTFNDEQPESFAPYPDLHFDRVSADRERYTAYRYRMYEFVPSELVPGFMTHQTPRLDDSGEMPAAKIAERGTVLLSYRARDWDWLGWRYSVLSSIAVAGWNNVLDMMPARDSAENANFRDEDRAWLRGWLEWTARNKELLRLTKPILGQPALAKVDGTAMIDADHGYIFLFNPDPRALEAHIPLTAQIGFTAPTRVMLREVYPFADRLRGNGDRGWYSRGDTLHVTLSGGTALVLQVMPTPRAADAPIVFGATGSARVANGVLVIDSLVGEVGGRERVRVLLPRGVAATRATVNGADAAIVARHGRMLEIGVRFGNEAFGPMHPVIAWDSTFAGGRVSGPFTIPQAVLDQLLARRAAWPIPWTEDDYRSTWLAPERLLLWAPFRNADDTWAARLTIDGQPVELRKAYTAVHAERSTFTGFYADVSRLGAGESHRIELELPTLQRGQFLGLYLENIEPRYSPAVALPAR